MHESLEDIWHSKDLKILRQELFKNSFDRFKVCEKCPNWNQGEPHNMMVELDGLKVKKVCIDYEAIYERVKE